MPFLTGNGPSGRRDTRIFDLRTGRRVATPGTLGAPRLLIAVAYGATEAAVLAGETGEPRLSVLALADGRRLTSEAVLPPPGADAVLDAVIGPGVLVIIGASMVTIYAE